MYFGITDLIDGIYSATLTFGQHKRHCFFYRRLNRIENLYKRRKKETEINFYLKR